MTLTWKMKCFVWHLEGNSLLEQESMTTSLRSHSGAAMRPCISPGLATVANHGPNRHCTWWQHSAIKISAAIQGSANWIKEQLRSIRWCDFFSQPRAVSSHSLMQVMATRQNGVLSSQCCGFFYEHGCEFSTANAGNANWTHLLALCHQNNWIVNE